MLSVLDRWLSQFPSLTRTLFVGLCGGQIVVMLMTHQAGSLFDWWIGFYIPLLIVIGIGKSRST